MKTPCTIAFALMVLTACGSTSTPPQTPASTSGQQARGVTGNDNVAPDVFLENGTTSASDYARYYQQFLFKFRGDCKVINTAGFQTFFTHEQAALGKDANGREIYADAHLNLFEDGTYWGHYYESARIRHAHSESTFQNVFSKILQGKWMLRDGKLVIDQLGEGSPARSENGPKVRFKFERAVHHPGLVGSEAVFGKSRTDSGAHGESINEYCHLPSDY